LARDIESRLLKNIHVIEEIGSLFNDYNVLIVENDSSDNTRNICLDWSNQNKRVKVLGCGGYNLDVCNLNMKKTLNHSVNFYRMEKMAKLRNIYLDEIIRASRMPGL
jgi:glycosyltransferase involved in cell wall biosynthesis